MIRVTTTSNVIKGTRLYVQSAYNPQGKGFKETLTTAVRQIVSSGEIFETIASSNGTRDSKHLKIR
jgi:hypothetical protein